MSRLRIMLLGVVSIVLMASVIGGATLALFTSSAASQENDFVTGNVEISQADATTWDANVGNMAPGDSYTKDIIVTNTGSLDLEFASAYATSGDLFSGIDRARVRLLNGFGTLAPGASQVVTVEVSLPLTAPDSYENTTGDLDVTFHAFQTKNVTVATATAVQTNDNAYNATFDLYFDGYEIRDAANNLIPLTDTNLLGMYMIQPDGTSVYLEADGSTDPKFWFNNAKPDGLYNLVIVTKSGTRYTASINHVSNATLPVVGP